MELARYYVNVQSKEVSEVQVGNNAAFTIHASQSDLDQLRALFDQMGSVEIDNFFRAHVPIVPYHEDKSNTKYDHLLRDIYQKIYELGDDETRQFIDQEGLNKIESKEDTM